MSVQRRAILPVGSKIFAIGSCFAVSIRAQLRAHGYDVYPKFLELEFDPSRQRIASLPRRDNINQYTTFSIRQEIERALSDYSLRTEDIWFLRSERIKRLTGWETTFQDPSRLHVYASSEAALFDVSGKITRTIGDGLTAADAIVITLGLTECWRNRASDTYLCRGPDGLNDETFSLCEFLPSDFQENCDNVRTIVERLTALPRRPKIILTVSPVALKRTWTNEDIVVANMTSKSILRTVTAKICGEYPEIFYWPSYEYASRQDVFADDGRHVRQEAVAEIVTSFVRALGTG